MADKSDESCEVKHILDDDAGPLFDRGPERYMAYTARAAQLLALGGKAVAKGSRYLAYTSDVGEAFRPVVNPKIVTASYGIAFAYVFGDVALAAYRAKETGGNVMRTVAHQSVFQGLASLALPFLIIHTQVSVFKSVFTKMGRFTKWGPTISGLALLPFLPVCVDEPTEHLVHAAFEKYWPEKGDEGKKHE